MTKSRDSFPKMMKKWAKGILHRNSYTQNPLQARTIALTVESEEKRKRARKL
jgi:hypothetical protein